MAKCSDIELLIMENLGGNLTADRQRELDAHLATCPTCRANDARIRQTLMLARAGLKASEGEFTPAPEALVRSIIDKRLRDK